MSNTSIQKKSAAFLSMERHSGPLPPAQEFKAYGDVLSTAPERILIMTEKEQEHRHSKENKAIKMSIVDNFLGMAMGIIVVVLCLLIAYLLGFENHDWLAGVFLSVAVGFASIFVLRKIPRREA